MSNTVYTPTKNNTQAGVERVFGLPQEFDIATRQYNSAISTLNENVLGSSGSSGDDAKSLRTITSEIRGDVSEISMYIAGDPSGAHGEEAYWLVSIRAALKDLDERLTALENQLQT